MLIFRTTSEAETRKLAAGFAKRLKGGEILALSGPLGSGKTAFVKGLARALGVKRRILSPTFIIMAKYALPKNRIFYHFDLYRLKHKKEILELGFREILNNQKHIVIIEWPEQTKKILPKRALRLRFAHGKHPQERIVKING